MSRRMRKKQDLSDFDHVMAVCVSWAHLAISEAAYVMGIHTQPSLGFTKNGLKKR